ncbi:MAG TPA: DNA internalization-related competence protein ComEC/Rec2, partial [Methyloversatilis sp.]
MSVPVSLALVAAMFIVARLAELPSWPLLACVVLCAAVCGVFACMCRPRGFWRCLAAFLAAFVWAAASGHLTLEQRLAPELEGRDIEITGVIASLPGRVERGLRFDFDVEQAPSGVPRHIALTWYDGRRVEHDVVEQHVRPALHAGSRWHLRVRLKRPHGNMNPHGFDYEAWLFERGIGATGSVRASGDGASAQYLIEKQVMCPACLIESLREAVRDRFERVLGAPDEPDARHPWAGVLVALAIGEQRVIPPAQWDMFARAGITHLVSISGLHVTMVAALIGMLAAAVWRRVPALALRWPAQRAAIVAGLVAAATYCALAGFGIPAQRTLIMLAVAGVAMLAGRFSSPANALALAVCVVLLLHPMAVTNVGFWLSFGAVALLFYAAAGDIGTTPAPVRWLRAQAAITLGLAPLTLAIFQQVSLVAPLANLVAIPLVSAVVTPLTLLAIVLPVDALLLFAHALTGWLMTLLAWLTGPDWALWHSAAPPAWSVAVALLGTMTLLAPAGWPGRALALPLLLPVFLFQPVRPAVGDMKVVVLDVGQGLAVHVQTATHDLLFDTGPRYGMEADAGERLVLPYLRAAGVARLDTLVISHADTDHSGGVASLLAGLPVSTVMSSVPAHDALRLARPDTRDCVAGERWSVDGVSFEMLHPPPGARERGARSSNALSCVLRVGSA